MLSRPNEGHLIPEMGVIETVEMLRLIFWKFQIFFVFVTSPVPVGSTQTRLPTPSPCSGSWPTPMDGVRSNRSRADASTWSSSQRIRRVR